MAGADLFAPGALLAQDALAQSRAAPSVEAAVRGRTSPRKAAESFEAFFLARMLDTMFSGIKTDGLFGGGNAEAIYRSMMNEEYGRLIARAGGIGIADAVEREILRLQEANP